MLTESTQPLGTFLNGQVPFVNSNTEVQSSTGDIEKQGGKKNAVRHVQSNREKAHRPE